MNSPFQMMQAMRNPQQFIQQMMNNSQVMQNPMAKNAIQMYQNGDTQGLKSMAENLCKERGITTEQAKQMVTGMFNRR